MSQAVLEKPRTPSPAADAVLPFALPLELNVADPELIRELQAHAEGRARDEYALMALRIGLLALKQARGQIDVDAVRREGERLIADLDGKLRLHAQGLEKELANSLKEYFHPESGKFQTRVKQLLGADGDLERFLRQQIGAKDSELARTLLTHVGQDSALFKLLSPKESEGILKALGDTLRESLADQRTRVLSEFSLNNDQSALSVLVKKLRENQAELGQGVKEQIEVLMKEFSLNRDDSALSQMVARIKQASETIDSHLTLDKPDSALARIKKELLELLARQAETAAKFQEEVKLALEQMKVRKAEALRSSQHGRDFEQAALAFLEADARAAGDVLEATGNVVGQIKNCKKGDAVLELGPEHAAAGARIVVEAKGESGYTLTKARAEIEEARKNRGAGVGLFVFARRNAPAGQEPFQRLGDDLFIVWDEDDPQTDLFLKAGLMVARALCTRQARVREASAADFAGVEKVILDIEKRAGNYDEVRKWATTIKGNAEQILERVRIDQDGVRRQIDNLRDLMEDLRKAVNEGPAGG